MAATKALLDGGADVSIMVHNGLTPRAIAQKDQSGIMKYLKAGGGSNMSFLLRWASD
jgi:hypothetical protein